MNKRIDGFFYQIHGAKAVYKMFLENSIVGKNIIATHQNAKIFLLSFKNGNFSNIAIAILDFSLLLPIQLLLFQLCNSKSCCSQSLCLNFCMNFVNWFMASFLFCFPYRYCSYNYCDSNSYCSFTLLKVLAKSKGNLFAIAFKSVKERQLLLSRQLEER